MQDHLQSKMTCTTRLTIYSTDFSANLRLRSRCVWIQRGRQMAKDDQLASEKRALTLATWAERVAASGVSLMGEHRLKPPRHDTVCHPLSLPGACRCLFLSRPRRRPFRASGDAACPLPLFRHPNTSGSWRQNPPPGSAGAGQSPCPIVGANRTWPATTTGSPRIDPTMNPTTAVVLRSSYSG